MTVKVAVIYYSSTGTVHALVQAVAQGATAVGAALEAARYQGQRLATFAARLRGAALISSRSAAA